MRGRKGMAVERVKSNISTFFSRYPPQRTKKKKVGRDGGEPILAASGSINIAHDSTFDYHSSSFFYLPHSRHHTTYPLETSYSITTTTPTKCFFRIRVHIRTHMWKGRPNELGMQRVRKRLPGGGGYSNRHKKIPYKFLVSYRTPVWRINVEKDTRRVQCASSFSPHCTRPQTLGVNDPIEKPKQRISYFLSG